jgi:hypothetical protein
MEKIRNGRGGATLYYVRSYKYKMPMVTYFSDALTKRPRLYRPRTFFSEIHRLIDDMSLNDTSRPRRWALTDYVVMSDAKQN